MSKDIQDILKRCATCQLAKSHSLPHSLHTPLPIATLSWLDVSIEFILALPKTQGNKDSIFVVVDRFSNIAHCTACNKTNDVTHVTELLVNVIYIYIGVYKFLGVILRE